jgi:hypothetical protein
VTREAAARMKTPGGGNHPATLKSMPVPSYDSDRLMAKRPWEGAAKLAPRRKPVNPLTGGR